ncbi:hypothetical protein ABE28_011405 [Peribacillus muralis]|uniref:Uncharacterized protein n=1 Tax=Peribacillus muralis TaxID=264697 RepID=A0A1B3XNZ6_9BACI|nr:hypothetical protein [Peribacillus muralis]AOH54958.1 hypothetical protein ABE28_011405 [Peribacillus muralis]
MGYHNYYHKCRQGVGRPVEIRTSRGAVHRGIIHQVTPNRVYIRPFGGGGDLGGFGYGGFNAGYGWGAANGFAFGAITSLVFLAFLW